MTTTAPNGTKQVDDVAAPSATAGAASEFERLLNMNRAEERAWKMALEPGGYQQCREMAALVAKVGMFKVKTPEDAAIRIMTGRALGLPMFASLKGIFSTPDGAVGIESKLKVALARRMPECEYIRCTERSLTKASYVAKRRGEPEFSLTFTIEEAQLAGLIDRGDSAQAKAMNNWNRWRADMLMARASGKIVDIVFPEAALGLSSAEELYDDQPEALGAILSDTPSAANVPAAPAPPPQAAPARDFESELALLQQHIADAKTPAEKKAARAMVAKFVEEAPGHIGDQAKRTYIMLIGEKKDEKSGAAPPVATKDPYVPPAQRGDAYSGPQNPPQPGDDLFGSAQR